MKTFRVSGPFAFRGNEPGSTFEADPKETQIVRAVTRGSITEEKPVKNGASKDDKSGDAGTKEA
jgi:hypothetical protein